MKRTAIVATILASLLVVPSVAGAQADETSDPNDPAIERIGERSPVDFDEAQARVLEAIDKRVEALGRALEAVAESEHLTEEHAATLTADYEMHRDGLLALRPSVEAATTVAELRALAEQVWKEHWVFALQIPRGRLTFAADAIAEASSRALEVADEFDRVLSELEANGTDVDEGWRILNEMRDHVADAQDRAAPVADTVLPIEVTDMPDAGATLQQARDDIRTAHDRMIEARDAANELRDYVRSIV